VPINDDLVVIVDDDPDIRSVLRDHVETRGRKVLEVGNGLEALWAVKHQHPRVVLLDLAMPRLGGLDSIKHIQKFDPAIRIIVVSASLTDEIRAKLQSVGVPSIDKPIDFKRLSELLG
jgi:CheY-like chemotaxis protein